MKLPFALMSTALALMACSESHHEPELASLVYPDTARVEQSDNYHGVEVADVFRWLEDDVRENTAVSDWVDAQNKLTFAYLKTIPEREIIEQRLTRLWDYEKYGLPHKEGGHYFYEYNNGLQNQEVVYIQASLDAEPTLLVDPNTWSDDGTIALASYYPSPDGGHLAYLVQDGGSDWRSGRVMDIETREVLDDELAWLKFTGLSWARDGSGFYYSRYPVTEAGQEFQSLNLNQAVYFHLLGTRQKSDRLVYANAEHPDWGYSATVTDDGAYLVITVWKGTDDRYQIVYQDLSNPDSVPVTRIEGFEHDYTLAGSIGDELYFRSNNNAPKNRLIAIDIKQADPQNWREVVPESEDVLSAVSLVGEKVIAEYMKDAWSVVKIFEHDHYKPR